MAKLIATSIFRQFKNFDKGRIFEKNIAVSQIKLFKNVGSHSKETQPDDNVNKDNEQERKRETKKVLKSIGMFALKTAVVSGIVIGGIAVAVPALGFTAGGVAAGSAAAAYQSAVLGGTIASGSAFATLQSIGAVGLAISTEAGIVAVSAAATGVHAGVKKIYRNKR